MLKRFFRSFPLSTRVRSARSARSACSALPGWSWPTAAGDAGTSLRRSAGAGVGPFKKMLQILKKVLENVTNS